ncbi:MAG: 6-phosphofructokinase [Anaerolineales bacterium]|nr:MAG: 6-phosphofructokinase [Anaerolineales bacterium]
MANKVIGILTAGGDCPGLNAAIRGVGKAALSLGMQVIGYYDGFHGLVENRFIRLGPSELSGILTTGGTILGTSRDKPYRMPVGKLGTMDMTPIAVQNYNQQHLDGLVCLGGDGTQKNALYLAKEGLNIITLPKTIDNDVVGTDATFGFDTAMSIATEAIDRLHSTAESHHRVIVVEVMGHTAGWLTLGAGIAGGADVILIPEIRYDIDLVAESVLSRSHIGKRFSIIAMAEGARTTGPDMDDSEVTPSEFENEPPRKKKKANKKIRIKMQLEKETTGIPVQPVESVSLVLARRLQELTGLESRVTVLGHLQRGGSPSPADRLLATRLGTACAELISEGQYGVMVASRGDQCVAVPLEEVAGKRRLIPKDHPWIQAARMVGTSFGD